MEDTSVQDVWRVAPAMSPDSDEAVYVKLQKKESVEFIRNYIRPWLELGWIREMDKEDENDGSHVRLKYRIGSTGFYDIQMFCSEVVFDVGDKNVCPSGAYIPYTRNYQERKNKYTRTASKRAGWE